MDQSIKTNYEIDLKNGYGSVKRESSLVPDITVILPKKDFIALCTRDQNLEKMLTSKILKIVKKDHASTVDERHLVSQLIQTLSQAPCIFRIVYKLK
jgi:hypothetical protein